MDELSAVFDDKTKRRSKRKSCPPPVMSFGMSSDSGIGLSSHSLDESIAKSVKRRKRAVNSKQFDSKYFFDSVVDRIEHKYKNHSKDDAIIDLQNMQIVDKKGFVDRRVRTKIGYFAENTLEDLRQNSFRDKDLITCPIIESTPKKAIQRSKNVLKRCQQNSPKTSHSRAVQNKQLVLKSNQLVTDIMISSDEDSNDSNESEELDESHPLVRYENRKQWTDNDYQIDCLKKAMEMLRNDRNGHFSKALTIQAMQTLKLPALPTGAHITPIIKFNLKGEPNFEFYFGCSQSPVDVKEVLQMDSQVIILSQLVYDCICLQPNTGYKNGNTGHKSLKFHNRNQIEFNP